MQWRKLVSRYLAGLVALFIVSWLVSVGEWHSAAQWAGGGSPPPTMRTLVGYSRGKQEEMERPTPVACDRLPAAPRVPPFNSTWTGTEEVWPEPGSAPGLAGAPGSARAPGPAEVPGSVGAPGSTGAPGAAWGWQAVAGTEVRLYRAYVDRRLPRHHVRILAMFPGHYYGSPQLYCQTRRGGGADVDVVAARAQEMWYGAWDPASARPLTPLLLSCPLAEPLASAAVVSVVTETCENPTNAFEIEAGGGDPKRTFTVCVKDLNFEHDVSRDLIEWLETNRILGVEKVDVYVDRVVAGTRDVLLFYQRQNFVRLFDAPVRARGRGLWQRRRDHIITYNDCLYRNIAESEFIIPLDIDEIVLPKIAKNLTELVARLKAGGWDPTTHVAAVVRNVFFFDFMQKNSDSTKVIDNSDIYIKRDDVRLNETYENSVNPDNLRFTLKCGEDFGVPKLVRHTMRSALLSPRGAFSKSITVGGNVLVAFNHYPLAKLGAPAQSRAHYWYAPVKEVQLNHYKDACNQTLVAECGEYARRATRDSAALRLTRRLRAALARLPCSLR